MTLEQLLELLEHRNYKELKSTLEDIHPVDIAEMMVELAPNQVALVFRLLSKDVAGEAFAHMDSESCEGLLNMLNAEEIKDVMEELYLDDAVDIMEELPANVVDKLLDATDEDTRARINELLNYPEDSAGSIMTVEYVGLTEDMTVGEGIRKIRQVGINKETIYTCYVTKKRKLLGSVALKDMLESSDDVLIEAVMNRNFVSVHTDDDKEDVAKITRKYGLLAVPVVDHEDCLVGMVTVDDAMLVLQDETTEDMNKMAAIMQSDETYFDMSVWHHAKNRIPWLLFLMLSATMTGMIMNYYGPLIAALPVLVSFIPLLTDTGGNCGSQSSAMVIRGLVVDEIQFADIFRVIYKESRVALMVGALLAVINGLRVVLMYGNLGLAIILGITLMCTIFLAKLVGCTLPLFADKLGLDPAIMAAPLITTLVDSGSVAVYFGLVTVMIQYL